MSKRIRRFNICSYLNVDLFKKGLTRHLDSIQSYAYCVHDKDKKKDGSPENYHVQCVLYTYNGHTFSAIRKWFDRSQNTFTEEINDDIDAFEYLTHSNSTENYKFKYSKEDIVSFNFDLSYIEENTNDRSYDILLQLLQGVPLRVLARRYKKDFIYRYRTYKELAEDIRFEELEKNDFDLSEDFTQLTDKDILT